MSHATPYVVSSFKLSAKIGDYEFPDVVSCSATFGLNSIPAASLVVATGRNVHTGEDATIHRVKNRLRARDKATVTLTITTNGGQTDKMEHGTYVIFEGFYAGLGYQRSFNNANYTLHLIHWLDDLNNSSMINGNWFPGAPFDLAQNAAFYSLDPTEGAGSGIQPIPSIDVRGEIITAQNVTTDLWGSVFKPIFNRIAEWPVPRYQGEAGEQNSAALAALERMPGRGAEYYVPLALDTTGLESRNIEYAIRSAISKDAFESFAYTTFWNKMVGDYGPQFFFGISPSVQFALPVPLFAGLSTPYTRIYADDYGYANFNSSMSQVLESIDVFYSAQSDTGYATGGYAGGVNNQFDAPPSLITPLGYYPLQVNQNRRGLKLLKEPPGWMTNIVPESMYSGRSSGVTAEAIGDCSSPRTGSTSPPAGWLPPGPAVREQRTSQALNRFAEHWYKSELLAQRFGELSGRLRFDIAPGSTVEIEAPPMDKREDRWWTYADEDSLFAMVTQVSFVINAEKATAGTSFALANIRTYQENTDVTITNCETCGPEPGWFGAGAQPRPPMFRQPWRGAPLAVRRGFFE